MRDNAKAQLSMCPATVTLTVKLALTAMFLITGHINLFAPPIVRRVKLALKISNVQSTTIVGMIQKLTVT